MVNVLLEREHGGRDASYLVYYSVLYCMEGEFEQIITKIRLSIKYKNSSLRSKFIDLY